MRKIKRLAAGIVIGATALLALPGEASAAACVNLVNVSGTGNATQSNDCSASLGVDSP